MSTVAVVLAAGAGSRFRGDGHKLLATVRGRPIHAWALDAAVRSGIGPVVVVTGAADLDLRDRIADTAVTVVHNENWRDGQMSSLRTGLDTAALLGAEAAVVGLADQPFVTPQAWSDVANCDSPIAVATYDGRRGNPVRLHRSVWDLLPTGIDEGARHLMRLRPELVEEVPCQGSADDIDTLEDLERWT